MIGRIAAAGFLLLAAAVPAAADPTGEGLVREFVGWVDLSEQWSASVSVDPLRGQRHVRRRAGSFARGPARLRSSIETLRLRI